MRALILLFALIILVSQAVADDDKICEGKHHGGCKRFVHGFDITGATNHAVVQADSQCACVAACLANWQYCVSYVWKYVGEDETRSCTLYSSVNLPPGTEAGCGAVSMTIIPEDSCLGTVDFTSTDYDDDGSGDDGVEGVLTGSLVSKCLLPNSEHDKHCVSGTVFALVSDDDPGYKLIC